MDESQPNRDYLRRMEQARADVEEFNETGNPEALLGPPITAGILPDDVMRQIVDLAKGADPDTLVVSVLAGSPATGLAHSLWSRFPGTPEESEAEAMDLLRHAVTAPLVEREVHGDVGET